MKKIPIKSGEVIYPVGCETVESLKTIKEMAEKLKEVLPKNKKISFCCRGSSGAIISGVLLAYLSDYQIKIIHIKKDGESSHGSSLFYLESSSYNVIIDDFSNTGTTLNAIYHKMVSYHCNVDCVCVSRIDKHVLSFLEFNPDVIIGRIR